MIDWESGIWGALQFLLDSNDTKVDRAEALEVFGRSESQHEQESPSLLYPAILQRVHRDLAEHFGLRTTDDLDTAFGASVGDWPAFPDSHDALSFLKTRYRLVILSNIDRDSFAASNRRLGVDFDAVYTAEDIGSYNPNSANFDYLLDHLDTDLGMQGSDVLHTAQSMYHDHVPAAAIGLSTAWIDRQRLSEGGAWGATAEVGERPATDFVYFTLGEMADAVRGGQE